ncbi:hypothetical protein FNU76_10305 [Chitinimonas arctica]|uniref:Uncharacterized protein n=1 Tax=Chitinimonas arctica TaxID=2594795 RepID=A0A516SEZ1_9NEIS|nr:hypothetical protein [Chitinimonas arctica]QDQ26725.1 hypothetical protein FNU76_10305 [Chitinimonas arctica]
MHPRHTDAIIEHLKEVQLVLSEYSGNHHAIDQAAIAFSQIGVPTQNVKKAGPYGQVHADLVTVRDCYVALTVGSAFGDLSAIPALLAAMNQARAHLMAASDLLLRIVVRANMEVFDPAFRSLQHTVFSLEAQLLGVLERHPAGVDREALFKLCPLAASRTEFAMEMHRLRTAGRVVEINGFYLVAQTCEVE